MDTLMLIVTGCSVTIAAAASVVAWRATGAERRRSAARVMALTVAAEATAERTRLHLRDPGVVEPPGGLAEFLPAREAVAEPPATRAASTRTLLGAPVADSGTGGRQHGLMAAAVAVLIAVGAGGLLLVSGRAPSIGGAAAAAPLELVALDHARSDGQLAVSGRVRHSGGGDELEAQVRVFDAAGILIATRSATVDAAALGRGADAFFTVRFGQTATAARYRVSFASRGTILPHVDRRAHLPAAVTADAR